MTNQDFVLTVYPDAKLELWYDLYWVVLDNGQRISKGHDTIAEAWSTCADKLRAELHHKWAISQICW